MTEYEIGILQGAFNKALFSGAPGISETVRQAIIAAATLRIRHQLNVPAPTITNDIDKEARRLYQKHTDNHPTVHCNRFPTWAELSVVEQEEWRLKAVGGD